MTNNNDFVLLVISYKNTVAISYNIAAVQHVMSQNNAVVL